jgi:hypothetical protein
VKMPVRSGQRTTIGVIAWIPWIAWMACAGVCLGAQIAAAQPETRGLYFATRAVVPAPLPTFAESRGMLPVPIVEDDTQLIGLYWKAWALAFANMEQPGAGSPLVSNFLDAAFSENIFLWDTAVMMRFARYGHRAAPFIESLDNFYALQREDGMICREFRKQDGSEVMFPGRRDAMNPPLLARAELEYATLTGDVGRLGRVLAALDRFARWLEENRSTPIAKGTLYWNTPFGSGMDNTPESGAAWVSMTAQMADMHAQLAEIARLVGRVDREREHRDAARRIVRHMNETMWDVQSRSFQNVDEAGGFVRTASIGSFWPLWIRGDAIAVWDTGVRDRLACVVAPDRAQHMRDQLMDSRQYFGDVPFATLSREHELFDVGGGYWRGSSWAPTTLMAIDGLANAGYEQDARNAASLYERRMAEVFARTGTIWENYAPMLDAQGRAVQGGQAKGDFVGWSGVGPIAMLIEQVIGIRADALRNQVTWDITRTDRHGVEGLRLGGATLSLVCARRESEEETIVVRVTTDKAIRLVLGVGGARLEKVLDEGEQELRLTPR